MDAVSSFALASGLSWASGFRLYATIFVVGILSRYAVIQLPESLTILHHPAVLGVAAILMVVEFLADKIPFVDSLWDSIQTFIRIPAGALLAVGAMNPQDPAIVTMIALLGGSLAGMTHATKAGSRAFINSSPEPLSNVATSFGEDGLWLSGGWLALAHPMVFIGCMMIFILMMLWMLPKIWRGIKRLLSQMSIYLGVKS